MYSTIYMPPYEVLEDMFPASERGHIINGYVKSKLTSNSVMWSKGADELLPSDRLISFKEFRGSDDCVDIIGTGVTVYPAFIEWLLDFNWRPYGTIKILKLKEQFT